MTEVKKYRTVCAEHGDKVMLNDFDTVEEAESREEWCEHWCDYCGSDPKCHIIDIETGEVMSTIFKDMPPRGNELSDVGISNAPRMEVH